MLLKKTTESLVEMKKEAKKMRSSAQREPTCARKPALAGERNAPFEADGLILGAAKES